MNFSPEQIHLAASRAREYLNKSFATDTYDQVSSNKKRDEVYQRFHPIFSPENIPHLMEEDYHAFLVYENNRHWKSLQRMGPSQMADIGKLRNAISILVDETRPLKERLDLLLPLGRPGMIPRFGRATITPILMVAYPDKYTVLNNPVEAGLRYLNLWPDYGKKTPFSTKYIEMNQVMLALARELGVDTWTLDTLWWSIPTGSTEVEPPSEDMPVTEVIQETPQPLDEFSDARFGLERYLQEFIRDNWEKIPQLRDWALYEQDGDIVGFEYNTAEVGRIDLLAHHKKDPRWLVIELKRNQSSDQTVAQILRYMGWIKKNLAENGDEVEGMIISSCTDKGLVYALEYARSVKPLLYDVSFSLHEADFSSQ